MKNKKIMFCAVTVLLVIGIVALYCMVGDAGKKTDSLVGQYYVKGESAESVYKKGGTFLSIHKVERDDDGNVTKVTFEISTLQAAPAYRTAETGRICSEIVNNCVHFEFTDGWYNYGNGVIELQDGYLHVKTTLSKKDEDCIWSLEELDNDMFKQ